jgi:hypothetical protein
MLSEYEHCKCIANNRNHSLCDGRYSIEENGIKAKLEPKSGETVSVYAFDGCICKDNSQYRCDGLFILEYKSKGVALISVELKGSDWKHGIDQLAYTCSTNSSYLDFKTALLSSQSIIREKAFLITTSVPDKSIQKRMEDKFKVRVHILRSSKAVSKIPNLRVYL